MDLMQHLKTVCARAKCVENQEHFHITPCVLRLLLLGFFACHNGYNVILEIKRKI